jgi:hypothetical protein
MIRSILAAAIGGLVTFAYLLFYNATKFTDPVPAYFLAGVISAVGTMLWPFVLLIWARRRHQAKQQAELQAEVDKQIAAQQKGGG